MQLRLVAPSTFHLETMGVSGLSITIHSNFSLFNLVVVRNSGILPCVILGQVATNSNF